MVLLDGDKIAALFAVFLADCLAGVPSVADTSSSLMRREIARALAKKP